MKNILRFKDNVWDFINEEVYYVGGDYQEPKYPQIEDYLNIVWDIL